MCTAQGWKSTGEKRRVVTQIVKQQMATLKGKEGVKTLIESQVGPKLDLDGPPGQLRRFYADHFQALDRFDRIWYQIRFFKEAHDWESYFSWSLLHAAIINARAPGCAVRGNRVEILDFLPALSSPSVQRFQP